MINQAPKISYRANVSEKYFRYFSEKTFSAESIVVSDLGDVPSLFSRLTAHASRLTVISLLSCQIVES